MEEEFDMMEARRAFLRARHDKIEKRLDYIRAHPDAVIRVNPEQLYSILGVDYAMRCARDCSVAGDRAIQGSDIDGGVIITEDEVPLEKQHAIIAHLRATGFDVYHPIESDAAKQELDQSFLTLMTADHARWNALIEIDAHRVNFVTLDQVKEGRVPVYAASTSYVGTLIAGHGELVNQLPYWFTR